MATKTEFEAMHDVVLQTITPVVPEMPANDEGKPFLVLAPGQSVVNLEHLLPAPISRRGTVTLNSTEDFCKYVAAYGETIALFANPYGHQVTAFLDYHGTGKEGAPSWCEHRAVLQLRLAPEWAAWTGKNGKALDQVSFAEFLEDNLPDIAEPAGADVLEAAKHLEAKRTVEFTSGVNVGNGAVQLAYIENIEAQGKGHVTIPTQFTLGLPLYEHGPRYEVKAKLRYRIQDKRLTFTFILDRPQKIAEQAFADVLKLIEKRTGHVPLMGSASIPGCS